MLLSSNVAERAAQQIVDTQQVVRSTQYVNLAHTVRRTILLPTYAMQVLASKNIQYSCREGCYLIVRG